VSNNSARDGYVPNGAVLQSVSRSARISKRRGSAVREDYQINEVDFYGALARTGAFVSTRVGSLAFSDGDIGGEPSASVAATICSWQAIPSAHHPLESALGPILIGPNHIDHRFSSTHALCSFLP
jgi:hypothetical protein